MLRNFLPPLRTWWPILRIVLAAAGVIGSSRCWAQSGGGTLLGQAALARGSYSAGPGWTALMLPESIVDRPESPLFDPALRQAQAQEAAPAEDWYRFDHGAEGEPIEFDDGTWCGTVCRWIPTGMLPWGPRTPIGQRHCGKGVPLEGTSWLNRPYSAGFFMGPMFGDQVVNNQVRQLPSFFGGCRLTWDYDYYWGAETRLGFLAPGIENLHGFGRPRSMDSFLWDASLVYYPWGDSRWRPFVTWGLGLQQFNGFDQNRVHFNETLLSMPFGIGIKWMYKPWIILRAELLDNLAFSNDRLDTMHNISLTAGAEVRFGGHRPSYWPWNPNRVIW